MAGNGLAVAGLGLAERLLPNGKMFWLWESPSSTFFSSFVYKNHAGSYLDLMLAVTCGMAAWFYLRGLRRLEKSGPAGLFAFLATCIGVSILVSYARGATLVMLVFLCVTVAVFVIHQLLVPNTTRKPIVAISLMAIFGYFLKTGLETLQSHEAWTRLNQGLSGQDTSLESRRVATKAALDMLKDYWGKGAGSGSFRFLFPAYQQYYPEIFAQDGIRLSWEHAHNDIVEIAVELGSPGVLLLLAAGVYLVARLIKGYFWENPLSGCVVLGNILLLGYAWWDFPFQCPAVLVLWCSLVVAATMWISFEELNLKG